VRSRVDRLRHRLAMTERTLRSLSPLATLDRGYAIVSRADDGHVLTNSAEIARGGGIVVRLAHGRLAATVESTEPPDET